MTINGYVPNIMTQYTNICILITCKYITCIFRDRSVDTNYLADFDGCLLIIKIWEGLKVS